MKTLLKLGAFSVLVFVALVLFATDAKAQTCELCPILCISGTVCVDGECVLDTGQCDEPGGGNEVDNCHADVAESANAQRDRARDRFMNEELLRSEYVQTLREIGANALLCHQGCNDPDSAFLCRIDMEM